MTETQAWDELVASARAKLITLATSLGVESFLRQSAGDVPVIVVDGYEIAADPKNDRFDVWRDGEPIRFGFTAQQLSKGIEEALDDDSDVSDVGAKGRRQLRLASYRRRILNHLRDVGDEWQPWPDVVEALEGRPLHEISPRNGRMRQAALSLKTDGLVEIRYGHTTVFDAVRLLPAGYTD